MFLNLFGLWRTFVAIEQFGGTPGYNLLVYKVHELAASLELFMASKGAAALQLRITVIDQQTS